MAAYRFLHWLNHQVGYETLLLAERQRLHGMVAGAVEDEAGLGPGSSVADDDALLEALVLESPDLFARGRVAETLGVHWVRGMRPRRAALYEMLAGWSAERSGELERASAHCLRAGRLQTETSGAVERSLKDSILARVLRLQGRLQESADQLTAAIGRFDESVDQRSSRILEAVCLQGLAVIAVETGNFEEADRLYRRSRALAQATASPRLDAIAVRGLGVVADARGDAETAERLIAESVAAFEAQGDARWRAMSLQALGAIRSTRGAYEPALAVLEEARRTFALMGERRWEAWCLQSIAGIRNSLEGPREAGPMFETALVLAVRSGDVRLQGICLSSLAAIAWARDDLASATQRHEEVLRIARPMGERRLHVMALVGLGEVPMAAGDFAAGLRFLDEAIALEGPNGQSPVLCDATASRAVCRARLGDSAGAREDAKRSLEAAGNYASGGVRALVAAAIAGLPGDPPDLAASWLLRRERSLEAVARARKIRILSRLFETQLCAAEVSRQSGDATVRAEGRAACADVATRAAAAGMKLFVRQSADQQAKF